MTRPHKLPPEELARNGTWRGSVPSYNEALRAWGLAKKVAVLDAQRFFERLPSELFSDECHFTPQGYERMARMVREEIAGETGDSPAADRQQASGERGDSRKR